MENKPLTDPYALTIRPEVDFQFLSGASLASIEEGIKKTEAAVRSASLAVCVALAKIMREELYREAGFRTFKEYALKSEDRVGIAYQTVWMYARMGESWIVDRPKLKKAGFKEDGNLSNLRLLDKAKKSFGDEAFKLVARESFRTIQEKIKSAGLQQVKIRADVKLEVSGSSVKIDGVEILKLVALPAAEKKFLIDTLKEIYTIRANGETVYLRGVEDKGESRQLDNLLKKIRLGSDRLRS
jgi:hypothetical protein